MAAFFIMDVTSLPGGALEGGKVYTPAMGAVFGLGVGAGRLGAFLDADTCVFGSSTMAAAELV